jgi:hypothetical protein
LAGNGGLKRGLPWLAFQRLEQRRLLAADVGAGADEGVQVEIDAGALDVLAEQARVVGFRSAASKRGTGSSMNSPRM